MDKIRRFNNYKIGHIFKRIRNFSRSKALILLYHRVIDIQIDPHQMCVIPEHFSEQLEVLKRHFKPMKLRELLEAVKQGTLSDRSIVVTFDDGYADNIINAKPLLSRYDIPATFFITSGCINRKREFWWDELERILLYPSELPGVLELHIKGVKHTWIIRDKCDNKMKEADRPVDVYAQRPGYPMSRQSTYHDLCNKLRSLPDKQRMRMMEELLEWGKTPVKVRQTHRPLSSDELYQLAIGDLVEIGAHTVTHSVLSKLTPVEQQEEILKSKEYLQDVIGKAVTCFSFPHGMRSDYTERTIKLVKEAGFNCACAAFKKIVFNKENVFQLPRVMVPNIDGEKFEVEIEKMFRGEING